MTRRKVVSIMQPTYLPWIGWFDLMDQADQFVLLDDVQFERHSWQHRNRIKTQNGELMLTIPVRRSGLATTIANAQISDPSALRKHRAAIMQSYARSRAIEDHRKTLDAIYDQVQPRLVDFLQPAIEWLRDALAITTPLITASELGVSGTKDERVRAICDALDATEYLATPGSEAYMKAGTAFDDGAIAVRYHTYSPAPYPQLHGDYISHLAALDVVLNAGEDARTVMLAGRGRATQ